MKSKIEDQPEYKCPTKLIEDTPSEKDELAYDGDVGPHERVARAISELIESNSESGGKMIGIEGGWGAGKSTVIRLLQKKLSKHNHLSLFYLDAWAHEGDPLRRTYLESLIKHFITAKWVDEKDWNLEIEILAKRKRTTSTRTVPKPTILGKIFSVSVLLVPIGIPFINQALKDGLVFQDGAPVSWYFVVGLLLTMAPLLVIVGNFIRLLFRQKKSTVEDWAFLVGNSVTETKQFISETPEPTSIEFEDKFRDLMSVALGDNESKRKAIIVLDNLDRIEPKFALSIWATLQTFLQDRSAKKEEWYKRIWIVIPYDPTGLRLIWDNSANVGDKKSTKRIISDSFIDKSFQLKFEVPPLVLSNWKTFLFNLLSIALPDHKSPDELLKVYHAFNFGNIEGNPVFTPTPRTLKLFVNDIGSIHRQWQHNFPLSHIAYFVLIKKQSENIIEDLRSGTFPSERVESLLEPDLRANLAGLAFNVKSILGQQLLLSEPIIGKLKENDSSGFDELAEKHGNGFWDVLDQVATDGFGGGDSVMILSSSSCIKNSKIILDKNKTSEVQTIINELKKAILKKETIDSLDTAKCQGLSDLCILVNSLDFSKSIVGIIRKTISEIKVGDGKIEPAKNLVKDLVLISKAIISLKQQELLSDPFALHFKPNEWLCVGEIISKEDDMFSTLFIPQTKFAGISEHIINKINSGTLSDADIIGMIVTTKTMMKICDWQSVFDSIQQRLLADKELNSSEIKVLLKCLYLLKEFGSTPVDKVQKYLANGGHLLHWLAKANADNDRTAEAWCVISHLNQDYSGNTPQSSIGNSSNGHNIFSNILSDTDKKRGQEFLDIIKELRLFQILFNVVQNRSAFDPLIVNILKLCVDQNLISEVFTPERLNSNWKQLTEHINEADNPRFDRIIQFLCSQSTLEKDIMELSGGFDIDNSKFYASIIQFSSMDEFLKWCKNGLLALNKETWESQLEKESDSIDLIILLQERSVNIGLTTNFQDALIIHAEKIISSNLEVKKIDRWIKMLNSLEISSRNVFKKRLLEEKVVNLSGNLPEHFYIVYGDELLDEDLLVSTSGLVSKLFSPILRDKIDTGVEWLVRVFTMFNNILDKCPDGDDKMDFLSRIQDEVSEDSRGEDLFKSSIDKIANILRIKARPK